MATSAKRPRADAPVSIEVAPLAGYAIAVATERRQHEIAERLEQAGARIVSVQAVRVLPQPVEDELRTATLACLAQPLDELVVSSAVEFRFWMAAVRRWRLDVPLLARFAHARLLASDARCADSLRELALNEIWSTAAGTTEELVRYLRAQPLSDHTVAIQVNGVAVHELCVALRYGGAEVVEIPTYQSLPSSNPESMRRLIGQIISRHLDAVALTGAAATESLLWHARATGRLDDLRQALSGDVLAVCLGPLTAEPLRLLGVPVRLADAPYVDELVTTMRTAVPERAQRMHIGGHLVEIRGEAILLDGRLIAMQPGPIAVLRVLARNPDRVLSPTQIRQLIPHWVDVDDHAIVMAVSRLRRSLDGVELVQTVMKRGYRLVDA